MNNEDLLSRLSAFRDELRQVDSRIGFIRTQFEELVDGADIEEPVAPVDQTENKPEDDLSEIPPNDDPVPGQVVGDIVNVLSAVAEQAITGLRDVVAQLATESLKNDRLSKAARLAELTQAADTFIGFAVLLAADAFEEGVDFGARFVDPSGESIDPDEVREYKALSWRTTKAYEALTKLHDFTITWDDEQNRPNIPKLRPVLAGQGPARITVSDDDDPLTLTTKEQDNVRPNDND